MTDRIKDFDLSVVIPARNEEAYIRNALDSVLAQTWPLVRLQAVVVDNASVDATADVVRQFADEHPELDVQLAVELQPGTGHARNVGARTATGRYLLFLDADSRLAPDLVQAILTRDPVYPAASIKIIADGNDRLNRAFFDLLEFGKVLFRIRAQMFYCERQLFLAHHGFDENLQVAEDKEFLQRLLRAGVEVGHLSESWIATSTRRLDAAPFRLGLVATFSRWAAAQAGIGRRWRY